VPNLTTRARGMAKARPTRAFALPFPAETCRLPACGCDRMFPFSTSPSRSMSDQVHRSRFPSSGPFWTGPKGVDSSSFHRHLKRSRPSFHVDSTFASIPTRAEDLDRPQGLCATCPATRAKGVEMRCQPAPHGQKEVLTGSPTGHIMAVFSYARAYELTLGSRESHLERSRNPPPTKRLHSESTCSRASVSSEMDRRFRTPTGSGERLRKRS